MIVLLGLAALTFGAFAGRRTSHDPSTSALPSLPHAKNETMEGSNAEAREQRQMRRLILSPITVSDKLLLLSGSIVPFSPCCCRPLTHRRE